MHTAVQCFDIDTNDDRILHCCLVYKQKTVNTGKDRTVLVCGGDILWFLDKVVLLFTNDTNLCSKALVCNVAVGNRKVTYSLLISLFSTHFLFLHSSWYFTTSFPFLAHSALTPINTYKSLFVASLCFLTLYWVKQWTVLLVVLTIEHCFLCFLVDSAWSVERACSFLYYTWLISKYSKWIISQ